MVGNCQAKTQKFSGFREEDQNRPVVRSTEHGFLILASGDPGQAGHQTFICRIVSEEHVAED
jgi:hypothetical protein